MQAAADSKTAGKVTRYKYVTKDANGRIVDRGDVYERQVGGQLLSAKGAGFGLERTTTVTKSKMTGNAVMNKTLKRNYSFSGFRVGSSN
jgi:hypothetical protein